MNGSRSALVSRRSAATILAIGMFGIVAINFAFRASPLAPATTPAVMVGVMALFVFLGTFGSMVAAFLVLNGHELTWREFVRVSVDIAVLPLIVPASMVFTGVLIGGLAAYFASVFMSDLHSIIIGAEFGLFAVIIGFSFIPFIWPVVHRATFCRTSHSNVNFRSSVAAPPLAIPIICGIASVLVIFTRPAPVVFIGFVLTWLLFFVLYRYLLHDRLPRFIWPDFAAGDGESNDQRV